MTAHVYLEVKTRSVSNEELKPTCDPTGCIPVTCFHADALIDATRPTRPTCPSHRAKPRRLRSPWPADGDMSEAFRPPSDLFQVLTLLRHTMTQLSLLPLARKLSVYI